MKWTVLRSGRMPALAKASQAPGGVADRPGRGTPEHQAGLLVGLAHRGERESRAPWRRSAASPAASAARCRARCKGAAVGISRSVGSMRPPGKTNLPGMKRCRSCRRPSSTFGTASERSMRMSVAESRGFRFGERLIADGAGQPLGPVVQRAASDRRIAVSSFIVCLPRCYRDRLSIRPREFALPRRCVSSPLCAGA